MTAAQTRAGKVQERAIVRWAKTHGFPHADRVIRTGAGNGYAHRADEGDIWLAPGVVVQSKRLSPVNRAERAVAVWLEQTEAQRVAAGADIGLLVVRREGCADVGQYWCHLRMSDLQRLTWPDATPADLGVGDPPLRLQLRDVAVVLRAYGYGQALEGRA